jgi:Leucine-rich repeat (LRR) protein
MILKYISLAFICLSVFVYDSAQISVGPCFMKNCLCTVKNIDIRLDLSCFDKNINRKSRTFESHFKIFVFSLKGLNISELPQKLFFGLEIERFDISSNSILSLSNDTINFTGIKYLFSLDFFNNNISKIDSNALEPLYKTLVDLDFDSNQIGLEKNIFNEKSELNKLFNLRKLNLNKNNMSEIPYLFNCLNLTSLILSNNNLNHLSVIFSHHIPKSIKTLDLSYNQINEIDQLFFEQFANLNTLNLKSNQLKQIADGTFTPSIKFLYLNKNSFRQKIKVVPFKIKSNKKFEFKISTTACFFHGCECSKNRKLDIENVNCYEKNINKNSIVVFDKSKSVEISLKYLNISELPQNFFFGLKIVRFDISLNKISSLTNDTINFTGVEYLFSLDFFNNNISKIDSNALEPLYKTLVDLDFDSNQIGLEKNIFNEKSELNKLFNLRKLNLNKNNVSEIPYLFNCLNLTSLILSNNNLYHLSVIFSPHIPKSIQTLDLSYNQINEIDQLFFEQFTNLNTLNLKSNQLKQIADGTFTPSIKFLYLNKNSITKIPFIKNSNNIKLDLSNNQIERITYDDFCSHNISHPFLSIDSLNMKDNMLDSFHPCIYLGLKNSNEFIKIHISKELYNRNLTNLLKVPKIEIPLLNENQFKANDTLGISSNELTYDQIKNECENLGFGCDKYSHIIIEDKNSTTACFFHGCECLKNRTLDIENVNCYEKNINKNSIVVFDKSKSVEISLKYLNISELPQNFFFGLKIVRFDISLNIISSLTNDTINFTGVEYLFSLDFFNNNISKIDSNALEPLYKTLVDLDFDSNQIGLEKNIFNEKSELNKLFNLRKLNLNKNNMSEIPYLFNCLNLTSLILSNNNLNHLSVIFSHHIPKSIKTLDLSYNQINEIDQLFFEQFANLNTLNLKSNQLKQIADGTFTPSIKFLYLNKNSITKIPFIKNSNNIKLDLSNNQIERITYDDFCSHNISHPFLSIDSLNMKDNMLDSFHPCLALQLSLAQMNGNKTIKILIYTKEFCTDYLLKTFEILKIEIPLMCKNRTRANETLDIPANSLTYDQIKKDCDNLGFSCTKNTEVSTIKPSPIIEKKDYCKAIRDLKNEISIDSLNISFVINYCNLTLQFFLRNESDSSALINVNEEKNKYCNIINAIKKEYNFSVNSFIKFQTCNESILLKENNVHIIFALKNITILNQSLKDDFGEIINDVIKHLTKSVINEDDEIDIEDRFITKWGTPQQSSTLKPRRHLPKENDSPISSWIRFQYNGLDFFSWIRYFIAAANPSFFLG